MSQTRSTVAGGTAAVLLLRVGTSILFAEPPRTSGEIGGPVTVTAAPGTDRPPAEAPAASAGAQAQSTGSAPSATPEGALPAVPARIPTPRRADACWSRR